MLFMVIVPIITSILNPQRTRFQFRHVKTGSTSRRTYRLSDLTPFLTVRPFLSTVFNETFCNLVKRGEELEVVPGGNSSNLADEDKNEDISIGLLFASKAIVQLIGTGLTMIDDNMFDALYYII